MYGARLKFVNLGDNFVLPTRGSREYTALQERISKSLEATDLSLVPGFEEVLVDKFRAYVPWFLRSETLSLSAAPFENNHNVNQHFRTDKTFGELEAQMTVVVDRDEYESSGTDMKVKNVLEAVANKGRIGNLKVEPESLIVREPGTYHSSIFFVSTWQPKILSGKHFLLHTIFSRL